LVRWEYPGALVLLRTAVADARDAGWLGRSIRGSAFDLDVEVVQGLGSYVCGEETALIHAIEGRRGEVSIRPPYPTERGLFGCPTVVNNVETLVNVPWIVEHGADAFRRFGTPESRGTKAICLNHGFARPGIVEIEFGTTLERVIADAGGGARGSTLEALAIGGPMGSIVTRQRWDVPVCYRAMRDAGIELGHGGILALPRGTDYGALALHWLEFMAHESCGRCAPCALGSKSALSRARVGQRAELEPLLDAIAATSLCAFGQLVPRPVRELLELERSRGGG
jgi:NADH-quinone oxidoreductase subunit F